VRTLLVLGRRHRRRRRLGCGCVVVQVQLQRPSQSHPRHRQSFLHHWQPRCVVSAIRQLGPVHHFGAVHVAVGVPHCVPPRFLSPLCAAQRQGSIGAPEPLVVPRRGGAGLPYQIEEREFQCVPGIVVVASQGCFDNAVVPDRVQVEFVVVTLPEAASATSKWVRRMTCCSGVVSIVAVFGSSICGIVQELDVNRVASSIRLPRTVQRLMNVPNKMRQEHETFATKSLIIITSPATASCRPIRVIDNGTGDADIVGTVSGVVELTAAHGRCRRVDGRRTTSRHVVVAHVNVVQRGAPVVGRGIAGPVRPIRDPGQRGTVFLAVAAGIVIVSAQQGSDGRLRFVREQRPREIAHDFVSLLAPRVGRACLEEQQQQ